MDKPTPISLAYRLATLKRRHKQYIMIAADLIALPLALLSAYILRLQGLWPSGYIEQSWYLFIATPIFGIYIFTRLGLYRAVVRFMGTQAIWAVIKGVSLLALFLWSIAYLFQSIPLPRSIPIIFAMVSLVYMGGSRLLVRHYYQWLLKQLSEKESVLIYGAGGAGIQLATALSDGREYIPVGFIDDDASLWGVTIKNLPVYSPKSIGDVIQKQAISHILLALPNASKKEQKTVLEYLNTFSVQVRTIPSMPELLSGQASIEQLRTVNIEDLLGRDAIPAMSNLLSHCIENKTVLVTGAGGSIGSELCRQIIQQKPKELLLLEISEFHLYNIHKELELLKIEEQLSIEFIPLLGSVCNQKRIEDIFHHYSINTVYHAAAYKHVPLVEHNVIEGIRNNVFGTRIIAETATKSGVEHFILVSTDKAVRPTNVMGATKRLAEMVLQSLAKTEKETNFSMVRFGNVLGSSGSVVPLFNQQIKAGGPITVTHKDITRYFMTIPEAVSLVMQAGSMAEGGDVFVLDMGEPVKINDLAKQMIHLSGLTVKDENNPDGDIAIEYTGLRPAEKLYEELLVGDNVCGTEHPKIMRADEEYLTQDRLQVYLSDLLSACKDNNYTEIRKILEKSINGYQPHDTVVDHLSTENRKIKTETEQTQNTDNIIHLR